MHPDTAVRGCGVVDDHDQVVVLWNAYLKEYRIGQRNVSREAGVAEPVGREPARGVVTGVVGREERICRDGIDADLNERRIANRHPIDLVGVLGGREQEVARGNGGSSRIDEDLPRTLGAEEL